MSAPTFRCFYNAKHGHDEEFWPPHAFEDDARASLHRELMAYTNGDDLADQLEELCDTAAEAVTMRELCLAFCNRENVADRLEPYFQRYIARHVEREAVKLADSAAETYGQALYDETRP